MNPIQAFAAGVCFLSAIICFVNQSYGYMWMNIGLIIFNIYLGVMLK